jgi:hypothetical protein
MTLESFYSGVLKDERCTNSKVERNPTAAETSNICRGSAINSGPAAGLNATQRCFNLCRAGSKPAANGELSSFRKISS